MSILFIDRQKPFTSIVAGIALHSLATIFRYISGSEVIYAIICLIGWGYVISGIYKLKLKSKLKVGKGYGSLIIMYMLLCLIMIIRGYLIDYPYPWNSFMGMINFHLFVPTYILAFLMPLVSFIPPSDFDFRCIAKWSIVFSYITVFTLVFFGRDMLIVSAIKVIGGDVDAGGDTYKYYGLIYSNVALVSLCSALVSKKVWRINTIGLLCALLINLICARRGDSAILTMIFILDLVFYTKTKRGLSKFMTKAFLGSVLIFGVVLFINASAFRYIRERGMNDNRSAVDNALMAQMDPMEKWVGKGLNGRYYFNLHQKNDPYGGWRYLSETGYYYLVLRGGYILTWLYIIIILTPAFNGIFKSKNQLCKALGTIMIISIVQLIPFGHLTFNLSFLIIWSGVRLCMSRQIRLMSNKQITEKYFLDA